MHCFSVAIPALIKWNCIMTSVIVLMYLMSSKLITNNLSKGFDVVNTAVIRNTLNTRDC